MQDVIDIKLRYELLSMFMKRLYDPECRSEINHGIRNASSVMLQAPVSGARVNKGKLTIETTSK
jgi:hypothetical protein